MTGLKSELTEKDTESYLYQGRLQRVAKGRLLEYDSILYLVNNLSGEMPMELASLIQLGTLNLSMNHLTGRIPSTIGNFERIETLDLSINKFSGQISESMSSLTFLNHLNLSYNYLSWKIPITNQFQTLDDSTIYKGNAGLCGHPLSRECDDSDKKAQIPKEDEDGGGLSDALERLNFFISMVTGLFVGFWGVCGNLVIKKFWRIAYFQFVDRMK